ncbi:MULTISPECIES: hypothetical protein [unclassified Treponema]|uniref:hypothetical protein n=1 Tax=unclassified Treponema TaxID=2638727 RepID=UPI0020A59927|nr:MULTISPECIES: hypothetical protein [unclassified Treponema]UTC68073.1 hypothetical protein E4O06_05380 [Treponema sp. OMZ 789]UTC70795.1 hypothetical protein E4O01_05525 [Treponema sp. OMZ 790]UTC73535.1 hypothetical protein E4O02_05720 [Treponema sp. OMZ 791]
MKKKLLIFLIFISLLFTFFFISCNNNKEKEVVYEKIKPKRIIKNNILIVLGKDYHERKDILKYLENEYGLGSSDSHVQVLPYSDMVKKSKLPRLRMINEKIEEQKTTILISIGIPEDGGKYLINAAEKNPNLTIISLLPMDEILPLEAASDIVVDFQIPKELLNEEKDFLISDNEVMLLLVAAIFAGEDINAHNKQIKIFPIEEFQQAFFTAQTILGKDLFPNHYIIKPYTDSDTGLQSHRYLLIYKDTEENQEGNSDNQEKSEENETENDGIINPDNLEGGA